MSAITGIFYRDGRTVSKEIRKMNDRLSHRGPDGSAIWCEGQVGLGHQMLWTTPESLHETLPFEEEGLVITADARIDNRGELSGKLRIEDKEEVPDSYFILKAYQKWGERCPEELLGDFAFAIWDKNEEKLFCARDHMGVKPFYYYLDDEMFVFGTEIKAFFIIPDIKYKLNERKLALYLVMNESDREITFYKDIKRLSSGHSLTLDSYREKIKGYWILNPKLKIKLNTEEDYVKSFRKIFAEAVRCRLRSYFPIGSELSGGLDSSSVSCMAKKILSGNKDVNSASINTFSHVYDETPECDERFYIKKITDHKGFISYFIDVDNISPLKNIKTILWQQDQPFYMHNITKQFEMYSKVRSKGIRILLSGHFGDEAISTGKGHLHELFVTFQWKKLINEINGRSYNYNESKYKVFIEKVIVPLMPNYLKTLIRLFLRKKDLSISKNLLNKKFLESLDIDEKAYVTRDMLTIINPKEYHYYLINAHREATLEIKDRCAANFNIEYRYPFCDKRLVEFCYSLPTEMKLKFGWNKYILRIAMENILPKEIQWRLHKTDFGPCVKKDLLFEKNHIKQIVYSDNKLIKDYINLEELQDIYNDFENYTHEIWRVTLLYHWLKYTDISL